jgi:aminoglycoside 3-N-acetyltransferase I
MSNVAYTFRQLAVSDILSMKHLMKVFGEAFDDVATYQHAPPDDSYHAQLLAKPHFITIVAETGNTIIGGLTAYVLDKFERNRRELYIYDLAVLEPHRRRGVATGMIGELKQIAAALDIYVIFVQADLADAPAIAVYESLGTKESVYHFDIAVPRETPR